MASEKQIAANRRNAQKSTGPKSPEGKAKVAGNRFKHGFAGENHTILPGEDSTAYESIRATLMREWEPESEAEAFQIELMAQSQWRLLRAARYERQAFEKTLAIWGPAASFPGDVERLSRYEARISRAYYRALSTLQALQAAAAPAAAAAPSASASAIPAPPPQPQTPPPSGKPLNINNVNPNPAPEKPVDHSNPISPEDRP